MEGHNIGRRRLAGTSGRFLCFAQGKRFGIASAVQDVQSRQGDREASHGEWRSGVAVRCRPLRGAQRCAAVDRAESQSHEGGCRRADGLHRLNQRFDASRVRQGMVKRKVKVLGQKIGAVGTAPRAVRNDAPVMLRRRHIAARSAIAPYHLSHWVQYAVSCCLCCFLILISSVAFAAPRLAVPPNGVAHPTATGSTHTTHTTPRTGLSPRPPRLSPTARSAWRAHTTGADGGFRRP